MNLVQNGTVYTFEKFKKHTQNGQCFAFLELPTFAFKHKHTPPSRIYKSQMKKEIIQKKFYKNLNNKTVRLTVNPTPHTLHPTLFKKSKATESKKKRGRETKWQQTKLPEPLLRPH